MNPRRRDTRHDEVVSSDPEVLARALYQTHGPALEGWANSRFADRQLAEEVVQETVLAAWRKYDQYDPARGSERAWLFGIAHNVAATRHRRNQRHLRSVPTDPVGEIIVEDRELDRIADRSMITDAIRALSPEHREVISAAYWDGQSTKEIATRFGIPDGTVKSRLHYALGILRTHLQEREVLR